MRGSFFDDGAYGAFSLRSVVAPFDTVLLTSVDVSGTRAVSSLSKLGGAEMRQGESRHHRRFLNAVVVSSVADSGGDDGYSQGTSLGLGVKLSEFISSGRNNQT